MRSAVIDRKTRETQVHIELELDGSGRREIDTGCGFLNHMLELFAAHGSFDLIVKATGDTEVDDHHTVEDVGIALGSAFDEALGDRRGICRYGYMVLPMDEALVLAAVDISGRAYLNFSLELPCQRVGDFDTELVQEFFWGFVRSLAATVHLKQFEGGNTHHIIEAGFKCFARALAEAVSTESDPRKADKIPSTKGLIEK